MSCHKVVYSFPYNGSAFAESKLDSHDSHNILVFKKRKKYMYWCPATRSLFTPLLQNFCFLFGVFIAAFTYSSHHTKTIPPHTHTVSPHTSPVRRARAIKASAKSISCGARVEISLALSFSLCTRVFPAEGANSRGSGSILYVVHERIYIGTGVVSRELRFSRDAGVDGRCLISTRARAMRWLLIAALCDDVRESGVVRWILRCSSGGGCLDVGFQESG